MPDGASAQVQLLKSHQPKHTSQLFWACRWQRGWAENIKPRRQTLCVVKTAVYSTILRLNRVVFFSGTPVWQNRIDCAALEVISASLMLSVSPSLLSPSWFLLIVNLYITFTSQVLIDYSEWWWRLSTNYREMKNRGLKEKDDLRWLFFDFLSLYCQITVGLQRKQMHQKVNDISLRRRSYICIIQGGFNRRQVAWIEGLTLRVEGAEDRVPPLCLTQSFPNIILIIQNDVIELDAGVIYTCVINQQTTRAHDLLSVIIKKCLLYYHHRNRWRDLSENSADFMSRGVDCKF